MASNEQPRWEVLVQTLGPIGFGFFLGWWTFAPGQTYESRVESCIDIGRLSIDQCFEKVTEDYKFAYFGGYDD